MVFVHLIPSDALQFTRRHVPSSDDEENVSERNRGRTALVHSGINQCKGIAGNVHNTDLMTVLFMVKGHELSNKSNV